MTTKRKAAKSPPEPKVIALQDSDDPAVIEKDLAKYAPGFEEYSPTRKAELVDAVRSFRKLRQRPMVAASEKDNGGIQIGPAEGTSDIEFVMRLVEAFGTPSMPFINRQITVMLGYLESTKSSPVRSDDVNAVLAAVSGVKPQNETESMLAIQMYTTHDAAMRCMKTLNNADFVPQMQIFGNLSVKLMRAYTMQMEALARIRRGGEQVVKHIHIDNRGGQAVVAETVQTGGRNENPAEQSHSTGALGGGPAMLGADAGGWGVPISSGERQAAVQDARWHEPRGAEGQSERLEARRSVG